MSEISIKTDTSGTKIVVKVSEFNVVQALYEASKVLAREALRYETRADRGFNRNF